MNIIVLHNSEDKASRDFVASIPKNDGNTYCVIDWYKQPEEIRSRTCSCHFGKPYNGPTPSAFPELVFLDIQPPDIRVRDSDGNEALKKQNPGWARVRNAQSVLDVSDPLKVDARKEASIDEIESVGKRPEKERT